MNRLNNTPLLMVRDMVESYLAETQPKMGSTPSNSVSNSGITAVIPVLGQLANRSGWRLTYNQIWAMVESCIEDDSITGIILEIDSGGGEVSGCFELVDKIYNARGTKPIIASVNEYSCSAAYAIASACDNVYVSETSVTGSIGVICVHVEYSKMDEQSGITVTEVFAGDQKNYFSPDSELTKEAQAKLQEDVNTLYELFCSKVARNRGLTVEQVKATQAATYLGGKAVDIGLADGIATFSQTVSNILGGDYSMGLKEDLGTLQTMHGESFGRAMKDLGFMPVAEIPDVEKIKVEVKEDMKASVEKVITDATMEGVRTTIKQIGDDLKLAGVTDSQFAMECVSALDVESAKTKIMAAQADESDTNTVFAKHTGDTVSAESPLVTAARKLNEEAKENRRK